MAPQRVRAREYAVRKVWQCASAPLSCACLEGGAADAAMLLPPLRRAREQEALLTKMRYCLFFMPAAATPRYYAMTCRLS